jgi:translocation and assembly module TamA
MVCGIAFKKGRFIFLGRMSWLRLVFIFLVASPLALAEDKIEISGISNGDLEKNVRLLLAEIQTPVGRINEDKYKQALKAQVEKALNAFGYYDAEININDLTFFNKNDDANNPKQHISLSLKIELGKLALVERVVLINDLAQLEPAVIPEQIKNVVEQVKQLSGKPVDHPKYENLKNKLKTFAMLYGFFDLSFPVHKLIVQPGQRASTSEDGVFIPESNSKVIIHWIFYLGQRYQFGDIQFLEETRGQEIARNVKTFEVGEYFEQSKVGSYSIDMQSTDYFSSAIARANADNAEDFKVPIEVILDPKPKDTFEFGVGFSTDTGPRFTIDWSRPWVNLDGHSLDSRLYLSGPEKSIKTTYRIPMANALNDFYNIQGGFARVDDNQTRSDNFSVAVQRQWGAVEEDEWDKIAFIKLEQESFVQGTAERESTTLLLPGFTFSRTRKRGDIFVDWGDLQQVTVEGGSKSLVSDIDFFKIIARTKWIRQLDKHRFTFRADAGAIATNNFAQVPSTQRFFAGGDQSIRGFGLNEVSDFDIIIEGEGEDEDEKEKVELNGGKFLAVASVEYSYPVAENFRAATFIDAGNANDNPFSDPAYGYGIGVHWLSPVGTVRFYVARGVSDFDKTYRVHLVIGPGL